MEQAGHVGAGRYSAGSSASRSPRPCRPAAGGILRGGRRFEEDGGDPAVEQRRVERDRTPSLRAPRSPPARHRRPAAHGRPSSARSASQTRMLATVRPVHAAARRTCQLRSSPHDGIAGAAGFDDDLDPRRADRAGERVGVVPRPSPGERSTTTAGADALHVGRIAAEPWSRQPSSEVNANRVPTPPSSAYSSSSVERRRSGRKVIEGVAAELRRRAASATVCTPAARCDRRRRRDGDELVVNRQRAVTGRSCRSRRRAASPADSSLAGSSLDVADLGWPARPCRSGV